MTIAIVTGSVAPYTNRLYDAYARLHNADLHVLQCEKVERGRQWSIPEPQHYKASSLTGFGIHTSDISHIYFNPGIIWALARLRPDTVIIQSFSPTMIVAALHASATGISLGLAIEGARDVDPGETSWSHAQARRLLASRATFGTCSSHGAQEMMAHWGLAPGTGIYVPHFGSWDAPQERRGFDERPFDLLFCGTLNERKNPMFLADVVDRLVAGGSRPRVRVVGEGPLRSALEARLAGAGVEARFDGYLGQDGIIEAYQSAKLLAFPTRADTWGLVTNEALLCGTPVLASPHAVSSRELVQTFGTGLVRPLSADAWAEAVRAMLASKESWQSYLARRDAAMACFHIDKAVAGLARAIETGREGLRRKRNNPDGQNSQAGPAGDHTAGK